MDNIPQIVPVIMAGGSGTRLWPLSRRSYPKQFLKLNGNLTLLQETIKRLEGLNIAKPIIVCNEEHRFLVAEQLREIEADADIILEPVGKNTAPSISLAALYSAEVYGDDNDPILLVLSADHTIRDVDAFHGAINRLIPRASNGFYCTLGVTPDSPNTGYGYIHASGSDTILSVRKFTEKPNISMARDYLASGEYYWNSGIFIFSCSSFLVDLKETRLDIYSSCSAAIKNKHKDLDFIRLETTTFDKCPNISFDYAILEPLSVKSPGKILVTPVDMGWSDIGSWESIWDISPKNVNGNSVLNHNNNIKFYESENCLVRAEDRLITLLGVNDLTVIDTKDALLIAKKEKAQEVKTIINDLADRKELDNHREVYRPWGKFDSVDNGDRYQVKRITVKPGAKLSLQMHHHRAEHWVVVTGTARVTKGEKIFLVTENESVYIPVGEIHCLENPGVMPLEIIEIQSGAYLGEDDIVRLKDEYGRK